MAEASDVIAALSEMQDEAQRLILLRFLRPDRENMARVTVFRASRTADARSGQAVSPECAFGPNSRAVTVSMA